MPNEPTVSVVTVNTGPAASVTVTRTNSAEISGIYNSGPQGAAGQAGATGATGDRGATGATGTLPSNYVISVNGVTGEISNIATLGGPNAWNYSQSFNQGIEVDFDLVTLTDITVNGMRVGLGGSSIPSNVAIGASALENAQYDYDGEYGGDNNTAIGANTLANITYGNNNVALGANALKFNTASNNLAIGAKTLVNNTSGEGNVAIGSGAFPPLLSNITGSNNLAICNGALYGVTSGADYNIAIGYFSQNNLRKGSNNIAIGRVAGTEAPRMASGNRVLRGADNSIYIGYNAAGFSASGVTSEIVIGTNAVGMGSNTAVIGSPTQVSATIYGILNAPSGVSANNILSIVSTPTGSASTGITGQVAITNTDLYICTATNTWRKVALTTF